MKILSENPSFQLLIAIEAKKCSLITILLTILHSQVSFNERVLRNVSLLNYVLSFLLTFIPYVL